MAAIDRVRNEGDATLATIVLYVVWFFFGLLGLHRMAAGRVGSGVLMLLLNGLGWLTFWVLIGYVFWVILGIWWLLDALLIPGWMRR